MKIGMFLYFNFIVPFITKVRGLQTHVNLWLGWRELDGVRWKWINVSVFLPVSTRWGTGGKVGENTQLLAVRLHQYLGTETVLLK